MSEKKYYLGLDVGTNSVGAACTYEDYNLLRLKGKDAWAVRLFDEANDASERRMKRTARRRLKRRLWRLTLLREIFAPHIEDKLFFPRLDNSPYALGDKDAAIKSGYILFADKNYTDKDYFKQFPTIFHLRLALMRGTEKYDLRLYYLALHHIVKYRGHFLFEGKSFGSTDDLAALMTRVNCETEAIDDDDDAFFMDPELASLFEKRYMDSYVLNDKKKGCCGAFQSRNEARKGNSLGVDRSNGFAFGFI